MTEQDHHTGQPPATDPAQPYTPTVAPEDDTARTKRRWLAAAIIGGVVVVTAGVLVGIIVTASQPTALERAAEACNGAAALEGSGASAEMQELFEGSSEMRALLQGNVVVEDDGKTLVVRTRSTDADPLGASTISLECVQVQLEVPTRITESISTTRALDGRQNDQWDDYTAQWGYHPDNGLSLIISQD